MKQTKSKNKISNVRFMINSKGDNIGELPISMCKCQNCNNIKLPKKQLTKKEIEQMFMDSLN